MAMPVPLPDPADDARPWRDRTNAEPIGPMTFDEYLQFSGEGDTVYEYVGGMAYAKNTGTLAHAAISTNIGTRLHANARRTGCRVFFNAFAVRTPADRGYVPDVMVECGRQPGDDTPYVERPCLIVEVLSPSTSRVDLVEKLQAYRELPSLQAYWIVEAAWRCVHRHWRDADGEWQFEDVTDDGVVPVPCLVATSFTLDEVYEDTDAPREPPRPYLHRVREPDAEYEVGDPPEDQPSDVPVYGD